MKSEAIGTSDMATKTAGALVLVGVLFAAPPPLAGQSPDMNFFLAVEGATWGADRAPVGVSDTHCHDLAYPQGYGHLTWRAYLTGTAADGEEDEIARGRIGEGPWYNYYGVLIAEDVTQLHSDENNLWFESAVTILGETAPEGVLEIPVGSQLEGRAFSRAGPFLCFGLPG